MKVIVVSGARSNVGKTHLSHALAGLLPDSVHIKIGHHEAKPEKKDILYKHGTDFASISEKHKNARYLILESNTILKEITPDCAIYIPADNPKPSATFAEKKADIIRGEKLRASMIAYLAKRLECDEETVRKIVELSGGVIIGAGA